ncbi:MAG TPA: DNRLRE domain-containing protein [Gaiellaceae bacterium]|nr:DNRLRE domain-containing protein [Gaiellaceae bacterium]
MKLSLSLAVLVSLLSVWFLAAAGPQPAASAVSPSAPPAAGLPAGSVELPKLRTRTSRTYVTPGGAYEAMISPDPLNYQDANGAWQPIDNSLVASAGGGYENAGNSFKTYLPSDAGGEVKVVSDGASVAFHLLGASGAGSVSGSTISYPSAFPGVDLSYQAEPAGLKESIKLASASAPASFSYSLTTSGVTPEKNAAGGVDLVDQSGKALLRLAAPVMKDAAGHQSSAFTLTLTPTSGGYTLTVTPDASWLASPSRAWPVTIDPTIDQAKSCSLESGSPTTSFCGASRLYVGWDGSHADRFVLSYDMSSIPSDSNVFAAKLEADLIQQSTTNPTSISLYQLTRAYTGSVTWNSYDGTNAWTSPGGDFAPTPVSTTSTIGNGQAAGVDLSPPIPYDWALTTLVRGWVYGTTANDGVLLKQTSESTNNVQQFDNGNGYSLTLYVSYRPRVGLRDEYTYDSQQLNDRMGINVNVANGNLVLAANDLTLDEGAGPALTLERFYNSALMTDSAQHGIFGIGWSMAPADIKLLFSNVNTGSGWDDSTVTFQDGDMSTYVFTKSSDGSYSSPASIDATLVKNGDSSYTLTFHPSGLKYNFPAYNGIDVGLSSIVDRNGNTDTFNHNAQGQLTSITTPRTTIGFTYGSNGLVSSISDGLGRTRTLPRSSTAPTWLRSRPRDPSPTTPATRSSLTRTATPPPTTTTASTG